MAMSIATDAPFSFNAEALRAKGIVLNPKRAKFKALFDGQEFGKVVGEHMDERFKSGNDGKWVINPAWEEKKLAAGYHTGANRMSGAVHRAMALPVDVAIRNDEVTDAIALREAEEESMRWGVNLSASEFADSGRYPERIAKTNPFAFIDDSLSRKLAEVAVDYLLELQKGEWQRVGLR